MKNRYAYELPFNLHSPIGAIQVVRSTFVFLRWAIPSSEAAVSRFKAAVHFASKVSDVRIALHSLALVFRTTLLMVSHGDRVVLPGLTLYRRWSRPVNALFPP